ncbi:DDE-type integrase/transposase/recombinase [Streptomyces sp. NA02950]|uniref:DDE-type integrase/transposase/recombinase n=1 Tax=Streptomyces sp. NA02950 TaxID=2742137 RepID=UPI0020CAF6F9|nr:DDE-type integrase/transposase/recombinase [Streptomyces sp. NA02950]
MRLAYREQGLWGLVDRRTTRRPSPTGRTDERVIAAVEEVLRRQRGRSKGTIKGLKPLVTQILEDRYGRGTVPVPSQATFYRLVHQLADPAEHPHRPARTLPSPADGRAFTPTVALRPGEQVQVDTTRLDVLGVFDDGTTGRPELTIAVDVATRAILAAVLRPAGTKTVDAALLLAEVAVPHPARPTWPDALRLAHAQLPQLQRLLTLDERLEGAAARPEVVPETIVVDRGKVYLSAAFTAACETLGISVQPTPPHAPAAKGIVERTFGTINALLCQHLPGYTGSDVTRRGPGAETEACFSVAQLQAPAAASGRSTPTPTTPARSGSACPTATWQRSRGSTATTSTSRSTAPPGSTSRPSPPATATATPTKPTSPTPSTSSCAAPTPAPPAPASSA